MSVIEVLSGLIMLALSLAAHDPEQSSLALPPSGGDPAGCIVKSQVALLGGNIGRMATLTERCTCGTLGESCFGEQQ
jgi:hypothetical protein